MEIHCCSGTFTSYSDTFHDAVHSWPFVDTCLLMIWYLLQLHCIDLIHSFSHSTPAFLLFSLILTLLLVILTILLCSFWFITGSILFILYVPIVTFIWWWLMVTVQSWRVTFHLLTMLFIYYKFLLSTTYHLSFILIVSCYIVVVFILMIYSL